MTSKAERVKSKQRVSDKWPADGEPKEPTATCSDLQQEFLRSLEIVKRAMSACCDRRDERSNR